jgi:transposase
MAKYSERFKLEVVEQYLQGTLGYQSVGGPLGVDHKAVKRWVDRYQLHGRAGLAKKFSHYSAEFKLSVLNDMWANELSFSQVSAKFDIRNPGAVSQWERCYDKGGIDCLHPQRRGRPHTMPASQPPTPPDPPSDSTRTREDLLSEVNHLRMENAYLKKLQALVQSRQQRATTRKKRK